MLKTISSNTAFDEEIMKLQQDKEVFNRYYNEFKVEKDPEKKKIMNLRLIQVLEGLRKAKKRG